MKRAIQLRVVAPAVKPSGMGVYQQPDGGELRSMDGNELVNMPPHAMSEKRKALPHERQSATSVETLMSSVATFARQVGQMTSIGIVGIMPQDVIGKPVPKVMEEADRWQLPGYRHVPELFAGSLLTVGGDPGGVDLLGSGGRQSRGCNSSYETLGLVF